MIARLDKLARDESVQQKLQAPDARWDLVVCDEAHKLSATFFGGEVKYTKRYHLGQLLGSLTRHFLLMTATPHNGKEEDFQLFMALLDGDRFKGRFHDGVHQADVSDLMQRMVKERLLKFDGTPLFPERIAYTVPYKLSNAETQLYGAVTDYVRQEFNRAEALQDDKRAGTVGFALTILQRRLASLPEAIYESLRRRRTRLKKRLRELELLQRGVVAAVISGTRLQDAADVEDLEEAPDSEFDPATLQRHRDGQEVALQVLGGEDGHIEADDELRLYAPAPGDRWNQTAPSWLTSQDRPGRRMEHRDSGPGTAPQRTTRASATSWQPRTIYDSTLPDPNGDHWLVDELWSLGQEARITVPLTPTLPLAAGSVTLTIVGSAYTNGLHQVAITAGSTTAHSVLG